MIRDMRERADASMGARRSLDGWRIWDPWSIATRMVTFAVVLVGFAASVIGGLSYREIGRAIEAQSRAQLTVLARDVAEHLHRELRERVEEVRGWTHLPVMAALDHRAPAELMQLATFLGQTLRGRKVYRAILCIGLDNTRLAGAGEVEKISSTSHPVTKRVSTIGAGGGLPNGMFQIEVPVFRTQNPETTSGTMVVLLDPHRLMDTIDAYLPGTRHMYVALRSEVGDVRLERYVSPVARSLLPAGSATRAPLQGVAPVRTLRKTEMPQLRVLVSQPRVQALARVRALRAKLLRIGVFVMVAGSLFGAIVAWWICIPIRRLTNVVRDVTDKRQLESVDRFPRARGEVGVLASSFREMMWTVAAAQEEVLAQSRRALLGEVAANIAHEVRTPLSVLKMSTQLIAYGDLPAEEQRDLATTAAAEVDRLNSVVTGLVDLARPQSAHRRDTSIDDVVDRAVVFFRIAAERAGVIVIRTPQTQNVRVLCNADQLHQVFLNLISNALRAMDGPGTLTIRWGRDDGRLVIVVDDTGPGFSDEMLRKVFSPFCTTKPDGAGLGLTISKRIVEEHGGRIAAANRPTGGASVTVVLPIQETRIEASDETPRR